MRKLLTNSIFFRIFSKPTFVLVRQKQKKEREDRMSKYIIQEMVKDRFDPSLLAAYELTSDGRIEFDHSRGNPIFIESLQLCGVGRAHVKPSDGIAFHEACMLTYATSYFSCNDEEELERVAQRYSSPEQRAFPSVA